MLVPRGLVYQDRRAGSNSFSCIWSPDGAGVVFLRTVILPHAEAFTVPLILFERTVAILILGQGDLAGPALVAGTVICIIAAVVSSPGGTVGNLALAAIQTALALAR
jgi:hypothetical protein